MIETVAEAGEVFSSSAIRAEIAQGDVKSAADALGHNWRVAGKVIGGAKRGTELGYPTANIPMPKGTALAHGIYAVLVHVHGQHHEGAAYLGTRPTFDDGTPVLETFLFDFDGDLYGREIEIEFVDYIRGDRRFDDDRGPEGTNGQGLRPRTGNPEPPRGRRLTRNAAAPANQERLRNPDRAASSRRRPSTLKQLASSRACSAARLHDCV